ncbi:branched-chain amino acid ABC transporter ATP-binding protein/permease [Yinghuangia aomiensis]|uniref:Branched-chain amino acid ABC transporter ATP-binding protein/permease n=1 Tax=Yinghuangia aomiensis TaxID=676205 RepID=A0ABP9I3X3_9ACTN
MAEHSTTRRRLGIRTNAAALANWYRIRPYATGVLAAAGIALLLAWPDIIAFYSWQSTYYVKLFTAAAVSATLVVSLNLSMGYGGLMSMMHTGLLAVGAYATGSAAVKAGWSPWLGIPLSAAAAAAVAAVVVLASSRAATLYFGMITLAADLLLIEAAQSWDPVTGGVNGLTDIPAPSAMSTDAFYYLALGVLALACVVQRNLVRSGTGRAAMAVRESPETAAALGIRPWTAKLRIFTLSGALAGLAGGLYASANTYVSPGTGALDNGLVLFVGLMIGGIGTLTGPVLGVATATAIDYYTRDQGHYRTLVLGVVLLIAMIVMPRGIVGTWRATPLGRRVTAPPPDSVPRAAVPESIRAAAASAEPGVPALRAAGLHKSFGNVVALDEVGITVAAGRIHALIGPNGSGKSTLIDCLTRFHRPDAGQVFVDGQPAPSGPAAVGRRGVTRVFQVPHLFEDVSVLDNVLTGMRGRERQTWLTALLRTPGFRDEDRTQRAEAGELLAFAGLAGREEWSADALSHGQKRLLEVVRAVAARPRVLILDEPATGLTDAEVEALGGLLRALRDRGLALLLVEHNVAFVMDVCDVVTVLDAGRVIAEGTPEEVRADPAVLAAYLGAADSQAAVSAEPRQAREAREATRATEAREPTEPAEAP